MCDLTNTIKIAKSMKRAIVHISKNYMLGTDEDFSTLSVIEIYSEVPKSFTAPINEIIATEAANKLAIKDSTLFLTEYSKLTDSHYYRFWDEEALANKIFDLFHKVSVVLQSKPIVYYQESLEKNPEFMQLMKLKVSDGLVRYVIDDKYLFTNFSKVQPINSTDKITLRIYDVDDISYLYEFLIDKKKYLIKEYIRYRKMII